MSITTAVFGTLSDGRTVTKYTIENANGTTLALLDYGAYIQSICVKDKHGIRRDVTVGFDDADGFEHRTDYQGAAAGPYANRIGGGMFTIDGVTYDLEKNEKGVTTLHGCGEYNKTLWTAQILGDNSVAMRYLRPDGLHGYPGAINAVITYTLTDNDRISIKYDCVSDKKTFMNPTDHTYFNLGGYDSGDILSHSLTLYSSRYTPVDENSIPTGACAPVADTPFDFTTTKKIGDEIDADNEQLRFTGGYDHNFCIDGADGSLKKAAEAICADTGIRLTVYTTLPGIQFYAGNFLCGVPGKGSLPMEKRTGFCLETQYYPDTPNHPAFPSSLFNAGEHYTSETVYAFDTVSD